MVSIFMANYNRSVITMLNYYLMLCAFLLFLIKSKLFIAFASQNIEYVCFIFLFFLLVQLKAWTLNLKQI